MELSDRIKEVCGKSHNAACGVLPPQICSYCFGCPIATIVVGVAGRNYETEALPIPKEHEAEVNQWLDRIEQKVTNLR